MDTNNIPIYTDSAIAVAGGGTVGATIAVGKAAVPAVAVGKAAVPAVAVGKAAVPLMASLCAVSKMAVPAHIIGAYSAGATAVSATAVSATAASGVATGFAVGAAPIVIGLGVISSIAYGVTCYNCPAAEPTRTVAAAAEPTRTVAGEHFIVGEDCTTSEPTCPICCEDFKEHDYVIRLQCNPSIGHEYHKECISAWARTSRQNRCPMCRAPFDMVTV